MRFPHTLTLSLLIAVLAASVAHATPVTVDVRIEGEHQTLFEGPIRTEGHPVEASSETEAHPCDGTNGGKYPSPGATPTAAAVDAMTLIGESFDGAWFSGFHDFLISRWGPEETEHWGVFVNGSFIAVGGCQYELAEGDRVLWGYDSAKVGAGARFLSLSLHGEALGAAVPSTTVEVGKPLTVTVEEYVTGKEGVEVTPTPAVGAELSPVTTAANGFQTIEAGDLAASGPSGTASVTFATAGWQRLKASIPGALPSNRLDVCVIAHAGGECPALVGRRGAFGAAAGRTPAGGTDGGGGESHTNLQAPGTETGSANHGVSAASSSAGPGQLRIDGLLLTPLDDRASAIRYHGHWRRQRQPQAFLGTVTVGEAGASLSVRLAAGRVVLILSDVRRRAQLAVQLGSRHERITIPASSSASPRAIVLADRSRPGIVALRILQGTIGLDGVAVTP